MGQIFKLSHSTEAKIIGSYPQVDIAPTPGFDYWGERSFVHAREGKISENTFFPNFSLMLPYGKLTDKISTASFKSYLIMVSEKFRQLLQENTLDNFQVFETKIKAKGKVHDYSVFYFPLPREEEIVDWDKSLFKLTETDQVISLNFEKFKEIRYSNKISPEKVFLKKEKISFEMFRMSLFFGEIYVLEELKNKIESAEITGCRFEPISWIEVI